MLIPACAARSEGCSLHLDSIDDDMLQLVLSFVDEPSDWAHAATASRSMREAASLSNWQRRLRLHFGVDVDPSGLGLRPGDHPPFSEFRGLWRAYYDGGWTPLRVDHRLLRHLTWHALKQQHEFGKAPVAHRVEVSDGAADSDDSEGEEAWPAEARRGLRSAWLLQAAACALDPLWITQNAPGSKAAAAVCTGAVLLDCQIDSAQPPELRRASTALLRALDACAARRLPLVADGVATGLCHVALLAVTARVAARCEEHDELSSLWAPAIDRGLVPQTLQTMQTPSLGSAVASRLFPLVARSPTASAAKMLAPTTLSALKTIWPSTPVNNTAPAAAAGDAAAA